MEMTFIKIITASKNIDEIKIEINYMAIRAIQL